MKRAWLRVGALSMAVVLAGCASAPPKPVAEAPTVEAQAPGECVAQAPSGDGVARLGRALGLIGLGLLVGALQGASDGAGWALWTGGSMGEAAWIGAAAGAGVGFLFGFGASLIKADSNWSVEPATPPACPTAEVEPAASVEDD
jgi:hypothetical protein